MEIAESTFHPVQDTQHKKNLKEQFMVYDDGNIVRRVLLNMPDQRIRELIVFKHFVKHFVRLFVRKQSSVSIVDRDNPWDFRVSVNDEVEFNIEITAIADDEAEFRKVKSEEHVELLKHIPEIRIRDLRKLGERISPDLKFDSLLATFADQTPNTPVKNPLYQMGTNLWVSVQDCRTRDFDGIMWKAIQSKVKKRHEDKEETILIVDNRTTRYEIADVERFLRSNAERIETTPFREIWLYTGYYSDYEAIDCEFSLMPIKITNAHWADLAEYVETNSPNEMGVTFVS